MSRFAKHNLHLLSDMKNQFLLTESETKDLKR